EGGGHQQERALALRQRAVDAHRRAPRRRRGRRVRRGRERASPAETVPRRKDPAPSRPRFPPRPASSRLAPEQEVQESLTTSSGLKAERAVVEVRLLYLALLKERCQRDGLGTAEDVLARQFRL